MGVLYRVHFVGCATDTFSAILRCHFLCLFLSSIPFQERLKITSSLVEVLSLSLAFQQLDCSVDLYDVLASVSREEDRGRFVMSPDKAFHQL